jgi:hypothetical protein
MKTLPFKTNNQDIEIHPCRLTRRGQRPLKWQMSIVEMRQANLEITSFLIWMEGAGASCTKQDGEKLFLLTTSQKELP